MKRNKETGRVEIVLARVVYHANEVAAGSGAIAKDLVNTPNLQVIVSGSVHANDELQPTSRGTA